MAITFLAALNSSRSLVVGQFINLRGLWKSDYLPTYRPTYTSESSDSSDSRDSSDRINRSDRSDITDSNDSRDSGESSEKDSENALTIL